MSRDSPDKQYTPWCQRLLSVGDPPIRERGSDGSWVVSHGAHSGGACVTEGEETGGPSFPRGHGRHAVRAVFAATLTGTRSQSSNGGRAGGGSEGSPLLRGGPWRQNSSTQPLPAWECAPARRPESYRRGTLPRTPRCSDRRESRRAPAGGEHREGALSLR